MAMSKKDYERIAIILKDNRRYGMDTETIDSITKQLADMFGSDNSLFDRPQFMRASQYP